MANSSTPIGKLMSYQQSHRDNSGRAFILLRQTGHSSIRIRRTAASRPLGATIELHPQTAVAHSAFTAFEMRSQQVRPFGFPAIAYIEKA